jgi:hypothetical protein
MPGTWVTIRAVDTLNVLVGELGTTGVDMLTKIKAALDLEGIMNPPGPAAMTGGEGRP